MNQFRLPNAETDMTGDRQPIRLDYPPRQEGIAAALRRAFMTADVPRCDDDFEALLAKLN